MESTISKKNAIRLMKDIRDVITKPLNGEGVYYKHDTENMLKGYAMIVGPSYGLYAHGVYFFRFNFPTDYPYTPPTIEYCTNDGTTRFNPNLYRQGKVCLSILNTWPGDSWTACQTIRSVLLQLLLLFNDKPLLNEPGVLETHRDFDTYHEIVRFKNIEYSIFQQLHFKVPNSFITLFTTEIKEHMDKTFKDIYTNCQLLKTKSSQSKVVSTHLYKMTVTIDYSKLLHNLELLKETF